MSGIKVLHLVDSLEVGGAEVSLLEIARRLTSTRTVFCHLYPGDTLRSEFEAAGIPVVSLDLPGRYALLRALRAVGTVLRAERPDLIQTTLFRADLVGRIAGWRAGIPVLSSFVNDSYCSARHAQMSRVRQWKLGAIRLADRWTARLASAFVANSKAIRDSNARALGIPLDRIQVIYRGRDPTPFLGLGAKGTKSQRRSLAGEADLFSPLILNVGRLLPRKGQRELVKALPLVLENAPEAGLVIAGEGPCRSALERLAQDLGVAQRVRFLGQSRGIPQLLGAADLFAFPSHYEGHPGALVEAMLAALPIVASDTPVHRETLGSCALLVDLDSPTALATAILKISHSLETARDLGRKAQRRALERFHIDRIAAEHEALYAETLAHLRQLARCETGASDA